MLKNLVHRKGNPPEPARATIYPQSIDIDEGEQFEIQYEITENPLPNIQWEREGKVPFNPRRSTANEHLRISYAVASDVGHNICRATNLRGDSGSTFGLTTASCVG
ncbi:Immunoglobulin I-set domain [Popillia japonica]|uniref:Immunoglobulin I-set domain n=1 Tax=Popillia japonica TaxID=7064 RepID=A0AAW1LB45_POPJA